MIQKPLPPALVALQATTSDDWTQEAWRYAYQDTGLVPVVFDEDGCDDMLRGYVQDHYTYTWELGRAVISPDCTLLVDATACCHDWKPYTSKPLTVRLFNAPRFRHFTVTLAGEFHIGPSENKRVFYTFEIEVHE